MGLSIIIVNWYSKEYLRNCLASIPGSVEVVVIDNGSNDGCGRMLEEHYPSVRFIQSPKNVGFAAANNRAALEATGDAFLFLNPDTELGADVIPRMLAYLRSLPDVGLLGCRLLNSDGTLQVSCVQAIPTIANQVLDSNQLRARWPRSSLWGTAPLWEPGEEPREVGAVSGACLMVERGVFERVGGFTEDYFMYGEDIDLAAKVRRIGLRNYYAPAVTVIHHGGNSSAQAEGTFAAVMRPEAIRRFFLRNRGHSYAAAYRAAMAVSASARLALLALPVRWRHGDSSTPSSRRQKWRAVLRWAVGRDHTVRRYYAAPAKTRAVSGPYVP